MKISVIIPTYEEPKETLTQTVDPSREWLPIGRLYLSVKRIKIIKRINNNLRFYCIKLIFI